MKNYIFFLFIFQIFSLPLHANLCWCNMWWYSSGGSWCTCPAEGTRDNYHHCEWKCSGSSCSCIKVKDCPPPMIKNDLGQCIPNPNLNLQECILQGGQYIAPNSLDAFTSVDNALASLYGNGCYSKTWVQAKEKKLKTKIKNLISPKKVLLGAIMFLPIGKIFKIPAFALAFWDSIKNHLTDLKTLEDNKPLITFKYDPEKGEFYPDLKFTPRSKKLPYTDLLIPPTNIQEGENIIDIDPDLTDFLNSRFGKFEPSNLDELRNARLEYDIDVNPSMRTKIAEDLRDIFKRSEVKTDSNLPAKYEIKVNSDSSPKSFPLTILDTLAPNGQISSIATRTVRTLSQNSYEVIYNIKAAGATSYTTINYHIQVGPADVSITPQYQLSSNTYIQENSTNLYNTKNNFITEGPKTSFSPSSTTNIYNTYNYYSKSSSEPNNTATLPNTTTFLAPTEKAITKALEYNITVLSCGNVTAQCPHTLELNWSEMGVKGNYKIPDPTCQIIKALNNSNISPQINLAGNLIVLMAGVVGALSLFRRN